jgi:phage protein D
MPVPNPRTPLVPDFDIIINGSPLPTTAEPYVIGVTVDNDSELPSMFAIELSGADTQGTDMPWIDDRTLFSVGNAVEIKLGYAGQVDSLIVGEITSLEPEFVFNRLPSLIVRGYDRRHRLQRGRKTRTFVQQKDSDIAAQIASQAGLTAQTTDSQVVHAYVMQVNQTDMEFLQERARRLQYEVMVQDKTLIFRPVANADSAVLTVTFNDDLLEFYPRLSSAYQVNEVTVRGWNPKEKKEIVGRAQKGDEVSKMGGQATGAALTQSKFGAAIGVMGDYPILTQAEADRLAKARFNNMALTFIIGEGICWGRTDLRPGKVIQIDGVGTRFSGQYYLTSTLHRYSPHQGYRTHFTVHRNAS